MLVVSGVVVGFINTLAGGGTIISITTFMTLGLPLQAANGTNRIPVILQNLTSSLTFFRRKVLDVRLGLKLALPAIAGNLLGAQVAVTVNREVLTVSLGAVMLAILVFMAFSTEKRLKKSAGEVRVRTIDYLWFFLIGFYGGYIYVGLGYMLLAVTLMSMRMDLVTANAIKSFVVLVSAPFSLAIFLFNGGISYTYGFIHAIGNIIGAYIASRYAIGWGVNFLRIFLAAVILFCLADLFGFISIRDLILRVI